MVTVQSIYLLPKRTSTDYIGNVFPDLRQIPRIVFQALVLVKMEKGTTFAYTERTKNSTK